MHLSSRPAGAITPEQLCGIPVRRSPCHAKQATYPSHPPAHVSDGRIPAGWIRASRRPSRRPAGRPPGRNLMCSRGVTGERRFKACWPAGQWLSGRHQPASMMAGIAGSGGRRPRTNARFRQLLNTYARFRQLLNRKSRTGAGAWRAGKFSAYVPKYTVFPRSHNRELLRFNDEPAFIADQYMYGTRDDHRRGKK